MIRGVMRIAFHMFEELHVVVVKFEVIVIIGLYKWA